MKRRMMMAMVVLTAALISVPVGAHAAGALPKLLSVSPGSAENFSVRPDSLDYNLDEHVKSGGGNPTVFFLGPGLTPSGFGTHQETRIHWTNWGATAAARATQATPVCDSLKGVVLSCSSHYLVFQVTLKASRVVHGRFTRFTVDTPKSPSGELHYALDRIKIKTVFGRSEPALAWCLEHAPGCQEP